MQSIKPGKQRKEMYNAPQHKKRKGIAAHLEENLLLKYDKRSISVIKGDKSIRKQVVPAVIVRQRKEYKRANGMRIAFEDNALVVLKDEKGNPKGTIFKGAIAKEAIERWPGIGKIASTVV